MHKPTPITCINPRPRSQTHYKEMFGKWSLPRTKSEKDRHTAHGCRLEFWATLERYFGLSPSMLSTGGVTKPETQNTVQRHKLIESKSHGWERNAAMIFNVNKPASHPWAGSNFGRIRDSCINTYDVITSLCLRVMCKCYNHFSTWLFKLLTDALRADITNNNKTVTLLKRK